MTSLFRKWFGDDRPVLRGHRMQSIVLTRAELVEIRYPSESHQLVKVLTNRARQRTFEAAYWRTSLGQFSFALVILKIFQNEFYSIGGTLSSRWKWADR